MTTVNEPLSSTFAYTAQTFDGQPMSGTIDAANLDDAAHRLSNLRLRVMQLDPAQRPVRAKPLSGEDFAAFNQQLAHLSAAGLPIEQGLFSHRHTRSRYFPGSATGAVPSRPSVAPVSCSRFT